MLHIASMISVATDGAVPKKHKELIALGVALTHATHILGGEAPK